MKKINQMVVFLGAMVLSLVAQADRLPNGFEYQSSGTVVPGEWTCQYKEAKELAEKEHIPLVAFVVKADCAFCKKVETCWMQNESFRTELQKRGYILLIGVYPTSKGYQSVMSLTAGSGQLPLMGTYWPKEDGTVVKTKFTGRAEKMGVPNQGAANTSDSGYLETGLELLARLAKDLGDYKPIPANTVGVCAENNDANDRMEFDATTTETIVRITRDEKAAEIATNGFVVVASGTNTTKTAFSWPVAARAANAGTAQNVTVTIPEGSYTNNETIAVYVADATGEAPYLSTNTMTYVELANSASNPKWIGEAVDFGEWTQDLDAAKKLASGAEGEAYTLAYVAGTRWCPDCHKTEEYFLTATNGAGRCVFTEWAKTNQIALAVVDVPRFMTNSLDLVEKATMLSRDAYTESNYGTGLGYLTRKNISDADAAEVLERNRKFVSESIDATGIHSALEDSNPYRTGVPYFVMLRKDGTVAARLTRLSSVAPTSAANNDKYLARLDEMLAIAATTGDHADATEAKNNAVGAGAISLAANGGTVSKELSHTDPVDVLSLTGVTGSANVAITVKGAADVEVTARFYVQTNAAVAATAVGTPKSGKLSSGISINYTLPEEVAKAYLVLDAQAAAKTDKGVMGVLASAPTFTPYAAEAKVVYKPVEKRNFATAAADGTVKVELAEGAMYRFDGLKNDQVGEVLDAVYPEDPLCKFFKAKTSGEVVLAANETVGYQLWKPGSIGFAGTTMKVTESVCDKTQAPLKLALQRTGGASGEVKAQVSVDLDATKFEPVANYTLLTTNELVWADGEKDDKTVELWIEDDIDFYQQVGQIVLKVAVVSSEADDAEVTSGQETFTVSVTEDDKSLPGRGRMTRLSELEAKKATVYLREGETFTFWAERIEAASGLVAAELKASVVGITFATDDPSDMGLEGTKTVLYWADHEKDEKAVHVVGFPAGKTTKINMNTYKTFKMVSGANAVSVVCVAKDAPAFASTTNALEGARYVAFDETFALTGTTGGALAFTKVSGTLPTGLKVTAENGAMRVAGVPTKAGTYEAFYQVTETRGKTKVPGLVTKLAFTIIDPVAAGSAPDGKGILNPACKVSRTFSDVMIIDPAAALASDPENTDHRCLYGTLTLTLPATGKATAKVTAADGTVSFKATSWSELDVGTGDLTVTLKSTAKGDDTELVVQALADEHGTVNIDIAVGDQLVTIPLDGRVWTKTDSAEKYQGIYTVTLPALAKETTGTRADLAPTGNSYLTAKMTSTSDFAKGKVTWAGKLANGTSVSGSAILNRLQANCSCNVETAAPAYLPIFKATKTDVFSAPLEIPYDAKKRWSEDGDHDCVVLQPTIQEGEGSFSLYGHWVHQESTGAGFAQVLNVFGSPYDISKGLDCCALDFSYSTNMTFAVSMPAASDVYGMLGPVAAVPVVIGEKTIALQRGAENPQNVKLSFTASTGIVKGSFKLPIATGSRTPLTASFEGVVVLGWNADDCGCTTEEVVKLPLVNGFWTITDKYNYTDAKGAAKTTSMKRGGAASIE